MWITFGTNLLFLFYRLVVILLHFGGNLQRITALQRGCIYEHACFYMKFII